MLLRMVRSILPVGRGFAGRSWIGIPCTCILRIPFVLRVRGMLLSVVRHVCVVETLLQLAQPYLHGEVLVVYILFITNFKYYYKSNCLKACSGTIL